MLHDWMFDAATDEDRAILQGMLDGVGALVMGRKGFDKNESEGGWGDSGPVGDQPAGAPSGCVDPALGVPTSPGDLVEAWPGTGPARWAKRVQTSVVRLRRVLGHDAIETTAAGCSLRVGADWVDAVGRDDQRVVVGVSGGPRGPAAGPRR